jgi:pimeloyl-ACP methyl ester carboxylesterase
MEEQRYRLAEAALWSALAVEPGEIHVTLPATGTGLRVQSIGEGPPVLFLHGTSTSGTSWAPLLARVSGSRCLVLDRPGCGLSEPLPRAFETIGSFVDFARGFVPQVLDALEIDRAPVVSTSFGGFFSLHSAAAHPDRIERLLHYAWAFGAPPESFPLVMRIGSARLLNRLLISVPPSTGMVKSILRQIGLGDALAAGRVSDEFIEWFKSMMRDTDTLLNEHRANPPLGTPVRGLNDDALFTDEVLDSIEIPVAMAWGTNDPFGGAATAEDFAARIPGADLTLLDGMGHAPWIDDPDRCAEIADAFLTG